jgi:outer membrane protein TolC
MPALKAAQVLLMSMACSFGCQSFNTDRTTNVSPAAAKPRRIVQNSNNDIYVTPVELQIESHRIPDESVPGSTSISSLHGDYPVDLKTVLTLVGADNPTIALADEAVQASLAEQTAARALLLPSIDAGANIDVHRGSLESSQGIIRDVDRQALYLGLGAGVVGAGPVAIPGIRVTAHLADAIYEPQIANQRVSNREYNALATRNSVLLQAVTRYLDLIGAENRLQAIRQSEREVNEVATLNANFARAGQGRDADAKRAKSELLLLQAQKQGIEEEKAVATANLARLLSIDPSLTLLTPAGPLPVITLTDAQASLESLIDLALRQRPEIEARSATIGMNQARLDQERIRPLVPLVSIGFSAGGFGGGSDQTDPRFGRFGGRTDFDILAAWSFENLGVGNAAIQHQRRAEVMMAAVEYQSERDNIRREVADAYAQGAASQRELGIARSRIDSAERAFRQDLTRSRNLEGRPIEVLNSVSILSTARQQYVRSLVKYNQAQFQLFVSLGQPPPAANQ